MLLIDKFLKVCYNIVIIKKRGKMRYFESNYSLYLFFNQKEKKIVEFCDCCKKNTKITSKQLFKNKKNDKLIVLNCCFNCYKKISFKIWKRINIKNTQKDFLFWENQTKTDLFKKNIKDSKFIKIKNIFANLDFYFKNFNYLYFEKTIKDNFNLGKNKIF